MTKNLSKLSSKLRKRLFSIMADKEERKPLLVGGGLGPEPIPTAPLPGEGDEPPPYMETPSVPQPYAGSTQIPPMNAFQSPPPYSPKSGEGAGSGQTLFVQCRVCQHVIHVPQGSSSRVVKCGSCQEATPISAPPNGKKYVRCPCNCLLTCSATATRVICPRPNCRRTIGVGSINIRPSTANSIRTRVICGHCQRSLYWPANAPVARCPHCRGRSYLNAQWMKSRAIFCLIIGFMFLLVGLLVTGITLGVAISQGGVYVISVGFFVAAFGMFMRAFFYCIMTRSAQET